MQGTFLPFSSFSMNFIAKCSRLGPVTEGVQGIPDESHLGKAILRLPITNKAQRRRGMH